MKYQRKIVFIFWMSCFLWGHGVWGQKPELVVQTGHSSYVSSIDFSSDGQYVLTGGYDGIAKIWDLSGRELKQFVGHEADIMSVAFSPDGKFILTGSRDYSARIWRRDGVELIRLKGHTSSVKSVAFSPDGQFVLTGSRDNLAKLWNIEGKLIRNYVGHDSSVNSVAFSHDGKHILTGSSDYLAKLWSIEGDLIQNIVGHIDEVESVAFSPDNQKILTGSRDNTARIWDIDGKVLQNFIGHDDWIKSVKFSPDGEYILTGSDDGTAKLWNLYGKELLSIKEHNSAVWALAFSPTNKTILTGSADQTAKLWDFNGQELISFEGNISYVSSVKCSLNGGFILSGNSDKVASLWNLKSRQISTLKGHNSDIWSVAFSPGNKHILTGSFDQTAKLWDFTGKELQTFKGHKEEIWEAVFSPDGKSILTGSSDQTVKLWNLQGQVLKNFSGEIIAQFSPNGKYILIGSEDSTAKLVNLNGKELQKFIGHKSYINSAVFSPDGKTILTGSDDYTARLWNLEGKELIRFDHDGWVRDVDFAPNGNFILTGGEDKIARLWNLNGKVVQSFVGHKDIINSVTFFPKGDKILTGSRDGSIKLWECESGKLEATIYKFSTYHGWIVTTPEGRFDGDEAGLRNLHYVVDLEAIPLERLKERYYEPGLLSKIMGFNKEALRDVSTFDYVPLYPKTEIQLQENQLQISLTERSGGIGRTALYINGKEVNENINPDNQLNIQINLNEYQQYFTINQPNEVGIKTYNAEGWLGSRLETVSYTPKNTENISLNTQPRIFALCIGTADYAGGTSLDLAYAEKDAQQMAKTLQLSAQKLVNNPAEVQIKVFSTCMDQTCPDEQRPTKANIKAEFKKLAKELRPEDVFILYLSGHGKTYEDYFYYLTQDMQSAYLVDPDIREQRAISTAEFATWLNAIPAQKQVMMIDACASGKFNEDMALLAQKDIPSSQIRALDRLRDRTGVFVISGSANDQSSYEASPYGMGLLTYSLLTGMSGGALREDEFVDVERLFSFAEDQVPVLAEDIGAIQTPKFWKPEGSKSFDIGRVTPDMRKQISLPSPKPVFARVSFFNEETDGDELRLESTLNGLLRDFAFEKGEDKVLIFVDADQHPNAYRLRGRYELIDNEVSVAYSLFKGSERIGERIFVKMSNSKKNELAKEIIAKAYERIK